MLPSSSRPLSWLSSPLAEQGSQTLPPPLAGQGSTRLDKVQYRYVSEAEGGFVELGVEMSEQEFMNTLQKVPGVESVNWHTNKHDQSNPSTRKRGAPYEGHGHFMERNVLLKSTLFNRPFEFELTRSGHTKTRGTCSMVFKTAPAGQILEAWRILRCASADRSLFSSREAVTKWHQDVRRAHSEQSSGVWEEPAPLGAGSGLDSGSSLTDPAAAPAMPPPQELISSEDVRAPVEIASGSLPPVAVDDLAPGSASAKKVLLCCDHSAAFGGVYTCACAGQGSPIIRLHRSAGR